LFSALCFNYFETKTTTTLISDSKFHFLGNQTKKKANENYEKITTLTNGMDFTKANHQNPNLKIKQTKQETK
jgi:hypothetical protein